MNSFHGTIFFILVVTVSFIFRIYYPIVKEERYKNLKHKILKKSGVSKIFFQDIEKIKGNNIEKILQLYLANNEDTFRGQNYLLVEKIKKIVKNADDYDSRITYISSTKANLNSNIDENIIVENRQSLENYDDTRFFIENKEKLAKIERAIERKKNIVKSLQLFLENNEYKSCWQYGRIEKEIKEILKSSDTYRICVVYISGEEDNLKLDLRTIMVNQCDIDRLKKEYEELKTEVLKELGFSKWNIIPCFEERVTVKSHQEFRHYDIVKFYNDNKDRISEIENAIARKKDVVKTLKLFLEDNGFKGNLLYSCVEREANKNIENGGPYRVRIDYISNSDKKLESKIVEINQCDLDDLRYIELETEVLKKLGFSDWQIVPCFEESIIVKSRQALKNYDKIKFFKENREKLADIEYTTVKRKGIIEVLQSFLDDNEYKSHCQYKRLENQIVEIIDYANSISPCEINIDYISNAGSKLGSKVIKVNQHDIDKLKKDPSLLMSKAEYNKFLQERQKEAVNQRQHEYYERVNDTIDYANENRETLFVKDSKKQLDDLIAQLYDRTVNSIKKIKTIDSEEWDIIHKFIAHNKKEIEKVVGLNQKILAYYGSTDFIKIKDTCEALMSTQREFNEYISEKVQSISKLFGVRVVRNETINEDTYNYIRPYKKTITPFTAELSATVFASAENNPMEYIVKNFYPDKRLYPEQIEKLCRLVEELQTLRDAKKIIENYKAEYQQYIKDVPRFIMEHDEAGFYSRLGFATIDESVLTVEYKFSYTSGGGMAKRTFDVPMTEETIAELIKTLESKLTATAFAKEQRILMTKKLREFIKKRDNYTCCQCGNSTNIEPNLLLEIDHIVPIAKGGCTVEDNLQTLCWKCNRAKSDKII